MQLWRYSSCQIFLKVFFCFANNNFPTVYSDECLLSIRRFFIHTKHTNIYRRIEGMIFDWRGKRGMMLFSVTGYVMRVTASSLFRKGDVPFVSRESKAAHSPTLNFPLCALVFEPLAVDMQFNFNPLSLPLSMLLHLYCPLSGHNSPQGRTCIYREKSTIYNKWILYISR